MIHDYVFLEMNLMEHLFSRCKGCMAVYPLEEEEEEDSVPQKEASCECCSVTIRPEEVFCEPCLSNTCADCTWIRDTCQRCRKDLGINSGNVFCDTCDQKIERAVAMELEDLNISSSSRDRILDQV